MGSCLWLWRGRLAWALPRYLGTKKKHNKWALKHCPFQQWGLQGLQAPGSHPKAPSVPRWQRVEVVVCVCFGDCLCVCAGVFALEKCTSTVPFKSLVSVLFFFQGYIKLIINESKDIYNVANYFYLNKLTHPQPFSNNNKKKKILSSKTAY